MWILLFCGLCGFAAAYMPQYGFFFMILPAICGFLLMMLMNTWKENLAWLVLAPIFLMAMFSF
jgi:hypothetical protein